MSRRPLDYDLDRLDSVASNDSRPTRSVPEHDEPTDPSGIETSITGIEHVTITGKHAIIETDIAQDITLTGEQVVVEEHRGGVEITTTVPLRRVETAES